MSKLFFPFIAALVGVLFFSTSTAVATIPPGGVCTGAGHTCAHGDANSIRPPMLSSEHADRLVTADSWVLLDRSSSPSVKAVTATTHASAEALCHDDMLLPSSCSNNSALVDVANDYSLRCVSMNKDREIAQVVGQWRTTTVASVMVRVDWMWAIGIVALLALLVATKQGKKNESVATRFAIITTYLGLVVLLKYIQPSNTGLFAPDSIYTTVAESFYAFVAVHPTTSPVIIWSHILTYWFQLQAWRSKSVRGILLWYFMYELVASFVNEYTHANEQDIGVRCTRVSFIGDMKQYALDDVVRAYLLPPFFVYLYLAPKLVLGYFGVSV